MEEQGGGAPPSAGASSRVVSISAGEGHTLALAEDGRVYSWGRGMFGRLGTGSEADELAPVSVKFGVDSEDESRVKFVGVAAGAYHSVALADDGLVWCWGDNNYGQLGHSGYKSLTPCMVKQFSDLGSTVPDTDESLESKALLKICSVKAGGAVSMAIDSVGGLWMWGNCQQQSDKDEENFSLVSTFNPIPVKHFHGHRVVKVACGNKHVVALVSAGETYKGEGLVCYSWGDNNHGQLGLGDRQGRRHPEIIEPFGHDSSWAVYEIACGASHTALLTYEKTPNNRPVSTCWTFGLGENGQLGHGTTVSALKPEPVKELPQHVYLVSVDCGLFHTSVVSSTGDVWSWGMEKGLGLCPDASFTGTDAVSPLLIAGSGLPGPMFRDPVQIACGAAHTVLLSDGGLKLWSWGRGSIGVLGNGRKADCFAPSAVLWPPFPEGSVQPEPEAKAEDEEIKPAGNGSEGIAEIEKKLSSAMEEMKLLRSRLSTMEQYASILHGAIFGKPFMEQDLPVSLRNSGTFDIAKEWENMLESADRNKLGRLEMFYRSMIAGVKDQLLKRRVQEIIKELMPSSTPSGMQ